HCHPECTQRYSSGGMILTKTEVRHQTYLVFLRKEASHGWRTLVPTVPADRPRGQDSPAKPGQDVLRRGHRQGSRLERVARAAHLLGVRLSELAGALAAPELAVPADHEPAAQARRWCAHVSAGTGGCAEWRTAAVQPEPLLAAGRQAAADR